MYEDYEKILDELKHHSHFRDLKNFEKKDEKYIYFENMKHPLLLMVSENVVANNFEIGKDYHSVIVTGSNTGGKTVTLKTIGLFILMAEAGMFLPCTYAKYIHSKMFLLISGILKVFCKVCQHFHLT